MTPEERKPPTWAQPSSRQTTRRFNCITAESRHVLSLLNLFLLVAIPQSSCPLSSHQRRSSAKCILILRRDSTTHSRCPAERYHRYVNLFEGYNAIFSILVRRLLVLRMAHRIWKETKQEPGIYPSLCKNITRSISEDAQ